MPFDRPCSLNILQICVTIQKTTAIIHNDIPKNTYATRHFTDIYFKNHYLSSTHASHVHMALNNAVQCFTSVTVVQVGKLVPFVVLNETQERTFDVWSHLNDKLLISIQGKAWCDEGDVKCPAERRYCVHWLLVIKSKNSINSPWELRTDWK